MIDIQPGRYIPVTGWLWGFLTWQITDWLQVFQTWQKIGWLRGFSTCQVIDCFYMLGSLYIYNRWLMYFDAFCVYMTDNLLMDCILRLRLIGEAFFFFLGKEKICIWNIVRYVCLHKVIMLPISFWLFLLRHSLSKFCFPLLLKLTPSNK